VRIKMAEHGRTLGTRALGATLLAKVERDVRKSSDALVLVDLSGVLVFSHSFADSLFAELVLRVQGGKYGAERWIAFTGLNEFTRETLDQVLKTAHRVAPIMREDHSIGLIGDVEPKVRDAFTFIARGTETTSAMLATKFGASLQAVNNWVAQLVEARVVDRTQAGKGSGRPYVYDARTKQLVATGGR
jgi:hypothetical protein